jgi:hypothetical protein
MPGRQTHPDAKDGSSGVVYLNFQFECNTASNPVTTTFKGDGILPQGTLVHTATGKYTLTLDAGYTCRYVIHKLAELEDAATDDGAYATIAAPTQGEGDGKALVFLLYTRAASGTKTDYAAHRKVTVQLVLKCSQAGA